MELAVTDEPGAGCAVVEVVGEIDIYSVAPLREALTRLGAAGSHAVVVDLGEVTFVDSAGLGVLVAGFKRARAAGGALHVVCTQPAVLRLFEITGVDKVLPIHDDLEHAVAAAGAAQGTSAGGPQ